MLLGMGVLGGIGRGRRRMPHGADDPAKVSTIVAPGPSARASSSRCPAPRHPDAFVLLLPHIGYDARDRAHGPGLLLWGLPAIPAFLAFTALRNFVIARPTAAGGDGRHHRCPSASRRSFNYLFVYGSFGMPKLGVPGRRPQRQHRLLAAVPGGGRLCHISIAASAAYRVFAGLGRRRSDPSGRSSMSAGRSRAPICSRTGCS